MTSKKKALARKHKHSDQCVFCAYSVPTKALKKQHHLAEHVANCLECGKVFWCREPRLALQRHARDGHRQVRCDFCIEWIGMKEMLQQHKRDKHYARCQYCNEDIWDTAPQQQLDQHIRADHRAQCEICGMRFESADPYKQLAKHDVTAHGSVVEAIKRA